VPNGTLRWSFRSSKTWHRYNRYAPMGLEGEMPNALDESEQHEPYPNLSHYPQWRGHDEIILA
ncbi:MAG: hypothetical protein JWQ98_2423, partial [Chlorobi bacterium]|nr:hypothetical protein [Chlorobiota bacterium]